jgi:serine/threonine protein kinase
MGRVYLGRTLAGRAVAIKVVHRQFAGDHSFRKRFEREVATARHVHGLYTASVVGADVEADEPWLATAYVPGPSLQYAVAEHGPIPVDAALRLIAGVAEALESIHAADVIHRDLKPSNVILTTDGPTVIDFGIARAADVTSITGTDVRPGTPAYMAPEQIRGETLTPAADVFALGVLAVFATTGRPAFGGGEGVTYRILEQAPDLELCPEPIREIAARCLTKDRQRRPTPLEVVELCQAPAPKTPPADHSYLPAAADTDSVPSGSDVASIRSRHADPTPTPPAPASITAHRVPDTQDPRSGLDAPPPAPRIKRRSRIQLFILLAIVSTVIAGGGIATWVAVNKQYFVGEAGNGEIAIFQGVRGNVFGISLNTQVQGSCDPDVASCDPFYVDDLRQLGRDAVRTGTESFDNLSAARRFIQDLRTKFPLPTCDSLRYEAEKPTRSPAPVRPTNTSPTKSPPSASTTTPAPAEPDPGVNCREHHENGVG